MPRTKSKGPQSALSELEELLNSTAGITGTTGTTGITGTPGGKETRETRPISRGVNVTLTLSVPAIQWIDATSTRTGQRRSRIVEGLIQAAAASASASAASAASTAVVPRK